MNFQLNPGKEVVILYKTQTVEEFDPDLETHFELDYQITKVKQPAEIKNEELFFDENALKNIVHFDHLKRSSIIAKQQNKYQESDGEEGKEERKEYDPGESFDLGKPQKEFLELEFEKDDPPLLMDENELLQNLIVDERGHVLACEVSATAGFDWLIGNRSIRGFILIEFRSFKMD